MTRKNKLIFLALTLLLNLVLASPDIGGHHGHHDHEHGHEHREGRQQDGFEDDDDDGSGEGARLELPEPDMCVRRIIHDSYKGKNYFFSWEFEPTKDMQVTWFQARNICRRHCMDTISLETEDESNYLKDRLILGSKRYTWTSGRKCNFDGCDRDDLQPVIKKGWFWSSTGVRLGPTDNPKNGHWGETGGDGRPQPDNRELRVTGENDEACLAVLNNFYGDGVVWHDIACYHKKYFVCEDSEELIRYVEDTNPGLRIRR